MYGFYLLNHFLIMLYKLLSSPMPPTIVWSIGCQCDLNLPVPSLSNKFKIRTWSPGCNAEKSGNGYYAFGCLFVFCCFIYLYQSCMPIPSSVSIFSQTCFCFVFDLQYLKANQWEVLAFYQKVRRKVNSLW